MSEIVKAGTNAGIVKAEELTDVMTLEYYSSMGGDSREDRMKLLEAISDAESLEDMIGKKIKLHDITWQPCETKDRSTDETKIMRRIILIDTDGKAYACASTGVNYSVRNLFSIVGLPPYDPPIEVTPVKKKGNKGFNFTSLKFC